MKLKGQAQLDLNNISISDLDYELNLTHSDLGVATKKKDGNNENGICLESNLGPIIIKFDLELSNISATNFFDKIIKTFCLSKLKK